MLKQTVDEANDAETIAHDALASIDARASEIQSNMEDAKNLQDNYAELKYSIEATKKALDDLDARKEERQKREPQKDMAGRIGDLQVRGDRIDGLRDSVQTMMANFRTRLANVRESLVE